MYAISINKPHQKVALHVIDIFLMSYCVAKEIKGMVGCKNYPCCTRDYRRRGLYTIFHLDCVL